MQAMNFKEITGLPRSHVVEQFVSLLQSKMVEQEDSVIMSKVWVYVYYINVQL